MIIESIVPRMSKFSIMLSVTILIYLAKVLCVDEVIGPTASEMGEMASSVHAPSKVLLGRIRSLNTNYSHLFYPVKTTLPLPRGRGRSRSKRQSIFAWCSSFKWPKAIVLDEPDCKQGEMVNYTWYVAWPTLCIGWRTWYIEAICQYCWQSQYGVDYLCEEHWSQQVGCTSRSTPLTVYETNCSLNDDAFPCFGERIWHKLRRCNWAGTRRWYTTLVLSLTLGGLGADRFYLGMWKEGFMKMFTFGGFGVWALIDAILIAVHHLGPIDGSLFVDNYYLHWKREGFCMFS